MTRGHANGYVAPSPLAAAGTRPEIVLLPIVLIAALFLGIASTLGRGETVKNDRVAQLYGYTICLIAVLTVLFVTPRLIGALSGNAAEGITFFGAPSISSFEAYKATRDHGLPPDTSPRKSDADLRAEYEAVRIDRLAAQRRTTQDAVTTSSFLIVVSLLLFAFHWTWLRRRERNAAPSGP